jgi:hypothetical protein
MQCEHHVEFFNVKPDVNVKLPLGFKRLTDVSDGNFNMGH